MKVVAQIHGPCACGKWSMVCPVQCAAGTRIALVSRPVSQVPHTRSSRVIEVPRRVNDLVRHPSLPVATARTTTNHSTKPRQLSSSTPVFSPFASVTASLRSNLDPPLFGASRKDIETHTYTHTHANGHREQDASERELLPGVVLHGQ